MKDLAILPRNQRELLFAIAFRDVFVPDGTNLRNRLQLEANGLTPWASSDGTYRFSVVGDPPSVPAGPYTVTVHDPRGRYVAFDPIEVATPTDVLQVASLWPTRLLTLPQGETAVVGQIVDLLGDPVPGLSVVIHPGPVPPVGGPEGRTDASGEFVVRLPEQPGPAGPPTLNLQVGVFDGATPISVTPASIAIAPGRTHIFTIQQI